MSISSLLSADRVFTESEITSKKRLLEFISEKAAEQLSLPQNTIFNKLIERERLGSTGLGQEMAGYATGEVFYTAQSLGLRHSHLDSGGYSYDQKHDDKDVQKAVDFLITDEQDRVLLTSMVACLFARKVYTKAHLAECLDVLGYPAIAENLDAIKQQIQKKRWQLRLATGFKPEAVAIPKRFTELTTWKGKTDAKYLNALKSAYAKKLNTIGAST